MSFANIFFGKITKTLRGVKVMKNNYLVLGAGAIGGTLAAYFHHAGHNVAVIARGENKKAINTKGITVLSAKDNPYANKGRPDLEGDNKQVFPPQDDITAFVKAYEESEYEEQPDVVFVCVKDYSLSQTVPFLKRICNGNTLVIPIMNSLTAGSRLAAALGKQAVIAPGIAYVAVKRIEAALIQQQLNFYTIVFGKFDKTDANQSMYDTQEDLINSGIDAILSDDYLQASLRKFFRVSILSALECAYNCGAGGIAESPERMTLFEEMGKELLQLSASIGSPLDRQPLTEAIKAVYESHPDYKTSMKLDFDQGNPTEFQAQVFDVVELGNKYGLEMPAYTKVSKMLGY